MPSYYSIDFRKKILEAVLEHDETNEEIAERFKVSVSTVKRVGRRFRETGKIEVYLNRGGRKIKIPEEALNTLRQMIKHNSSLTLREMQEVLDSKFGIQVTLPTIHIALKGKNVRYKKNSPYAIQQDREDVKKKARIFKMGTKARSR